MAYHHPRYERDLQNQSLPGHPEDANLTIRKFHTNQSPIEGSPSLSRTIIFNFP